MKSIIKLLRIPQWVKNTFVFLPAFFSGKLFDVKIFISATIAFFIFSVTASIIYIINDYVDIEKDKLHPEKKKRPLASGVITKKQALLLLLPLCFIVIFSAFLYLNFYAIIVLCIYVVLNLLYTYKWKQVAILDVVIIAIGFVLRVVFGGVITSIVVSKWALLLTFSLALILAFGKRRGELLLIDNASRKSLSGYNLDFLNVSLTISVTITLLSYIMYAISDEVMQNFNNTYVYVTSIFVLIGLLRYLQQTLVFNTTESPTKFLYKDKFTQLMLLCWVISFLLIIYLK